MSDKIAPKTPVKNVDPAIAKPQVVTKPSAGPKRAQPQVRADQNSSTLSDLGDLVKPAAPDKPAADFDFQNTGPVWWVSLDNAHTHDLEAVVATLGALTGLVWPPAAAAIEASIPYIELVNKFGGNNGVDINGVVGTDGLIVTPRVGKLYGELIQAARLEVSGRTIVDFIIVASKSVPELGAALNLPVVASVLAAVESGTPLGWALAAALGFAVNLLGSAPDPNEHGHIWANRDQAQQWESFLLAHIDDGNKVSLLSWQGLFSAQMGGGNDVYANRPQVGDWETWTLIDNGDGTVSFKSFNGNYLSAQEGGGDGMAVYVNRTAIGDWEKFYLVNMPDGKVALKTKLKGKFVSVQQ
jgi:hypothetical protein